MPDARTACETCGRDTRGADRCPRHPGARLLDLENPEDVAWRDSVRSVRRARRWGGLGTGAAGVGGALGLAGMVAYVDTHWLRLWPEDDVGTLLVLAAAVGLSLVLALSAVVSSRRAQDAAGLRHRVLIRIAAGLALMAGPLCLIGGPAMLFESSGQVLFLLTLLAFPLATAAARAPAAGRPPEEDEPEAAALPDWEPLLTLSEVAPPVAEETPRPRPRQRIR